MKDYIKIQKAVSFQIMLFISLILPSVSIFSQTQKPWQWVKQIGGPHWDVSCGVVIDSKNKVFVAGSFSDNLKVDNKKVTSKGDQDIFLTRFDVKGNVEKLWSFGGKRDDQVNSLCISSGKNIILCGIIGDTVDFDKTKIKNSGPSLFISSVNNNGEVSWVKTLSYNGVSNFTSIKADSLGNIYAIGSYTGSIKEGDLSITSKGKKNIFLVKLSSGGSINQLISLGDQGTIIPSAFNVNKGGDVFLSGNYSSSFSMDTIQFEAKHKANNFLLKLSNNLSPIWSKNFSGQDYVNISSIVTDASKNIYLGGSFNFGLTLEDTTIRSIGNSDGFIVKYNSEGQRSWIKKIGSKYYDYINQLNNDNIGGIIATGCIGDTLQIDSLVIAPKSQSDVALVVQLGTKGDLIWADYMEGSGRNYGYGSAIDSNGNLYYAGSFGKTFAKEDGVLTSLGDQDVFLARYKNCDEDLVNFIGSNLICPGQLTELGVSNSYKTILWNDSITTNYLQVANPGKYKVVITDKKGCKYYGSTIMSLTTRPSYSLGPDTAILAIDTIYLESPKQMSYYQWQDGSQTESYVVYSAQNKTGKGDYWINYIDSTGCQWSDSITIQFREASDILDGESVNLIVYPNPVVDILYWKVEISQTSRLMIEITDNTGHKLYTEKIPYYESGTVKQVNMSQYPNGSYVVNIRNTSTGKIYTSQNIVKR